MNIIQNFPSRWNTKFKLFIVWSISVVFLGTYITGCGHSNPFYRSDGEPPVKPPVSLDQVQQRILLIGDAGKPREKEPVLQKLADWAGQLPQKTTVIFLGDNLYPNGMPPPEDDWRGEAERRLSAQIDVLKKSGARAVFLPGNHDWGYGKKGLIRQQNFVLESMDDDSSFLPLNGCPGPVKIDRKGIRIIALDSDWWIREELQENVDCPQKDHKSALQELERLLDSAEDRNIVVVAHHPLASHGPHGGFFDWKDHLFPLTNLADWAWLPLPVVGSLYPLMRWHVLKQHEDNDHAIYKTMIAQFSGTFSINPPLVYASGHEHVLQVLKGGQNVQYLLVSGAGSKEKITKVTDGPNTLFAHQHTGFMVLDFLKDQRVLLRVVEPVEPETLYYKWLDN